MWQEAMAHMNIVDKKRVPKVEPFSYRNLSLLIYSMKIRDIRNPMAIINKCLNANICEGIILFSIASTK